MPRRLGILGAVVRSLQLAAACIAALVGALSVPRAVHAEQALEVALVKPGEVRVDGQLGEWRGASFGRAGESRGASVEYGLALEPGADGALYLGARVFDDELVRSRRPGPKEDAIVLVLALPDARGRYRAHEVWLYAGEIGRSPASAATAPAGGRPRANKRITVVEGPLGDGEGYVLEARIPLSVIDHARELQVARGAVRMHDVDDQRGSEPSVTASVSARKAARLPPLMLGANAALHGFLRSKRLTTANLRYDLIGDVHGDGRLERVVLAETFAVVVGPDVQSGEGFHYVDLPVTRASGVRRASLRDLTGDGKQELVLTLRQRDDQGLRELFHVTDLSGKQARTLFALELRRETSQGEIKAELRIAEGKAGSPPTLHVSAGAARGLSPDSYRARRVSGIEPVLLPWGKLRSRSYRWDGSGFGVVDEQPNNDYGATVDRTQARAASPSAPRRASHRKPPGVDELVGEFRRARAVPADEEPRFVRHVDLAEDERVESLMLFGKHLLVVGRGFRGGQGFFYFELPVGAATDIQRLFTGDVTKDGRREIFVRFKQRLTGPDGQPVQREILLGYTFAGETLQPILAVEVRRAQGDKSIGNVVELVPDGRHWALVISPGRARGWSEQSYPFVAQSMDGYGPLLLPWKDRPARYRFDGSSLRALRSR